MIGSSLHGPIVSHDIPNLRVISKDHQVPGKDQVIYLSGHLGQASGMPKEPEIIYRGLASETCGKRDLMIKD
jgi:hypothetical protein